MLTVQSALWINSFLATSLFGLSCLGPPQYHFRSVLVITISLVAVRVVISTRARATTIGAFVITCTILGVPYYIYSILGP